MQFHNAKKRDREIEAFAKRKGVYRVLKVLDRMTGPASSPTK